jgi:hypothetical protein
LLKDIVEDGKFLILKIEEEEYVGRKMKLFSSKKLSL